ncbi:MAG TPA: WHG domain-containing protein [Acidimicrobiales bacterium]|nr:WHG domain-containing protein [Acidimicrobiales bacterium]
MVTESPRRRLDRATVLSAAETLVDRDGSEALTMTALARAVGVKVSSLYNHVTSLDALRGELQNRTMRELGTILRNEAMGKTGERGLRALAVRLREYARTHPGRYGLAMSEPHDPDGFTEASADAMAAFAAIIRSYGIDDVSLDFQISAFAALHGVIVLDNAGFLTGSLDGDRTFDVVLGLVVGFLAEAASPPEALAG